jgi:hypothetical protein
MSIAAILHVLNHSKALQSHQTILVQLANFANDQGSAWPSVATLMAKTGYKRRWVETVLEELVRVGEIAREKAGRSYRYRLPVYDTKTNTCTCAVTAHIDREPDGHAHLLPEHAQLLPEYAQSSAANPRCHKQNPAEPCIEPYSEPGGVLTHEETKRRLGRPQDVDPTYMTDIRQILRQAGY